MADQSEPTSDPTELREEAEAEVEDLEKQASDEEAERLEERDALGVDEPRDPA